jgi:mannosyl-oligosaccharide alpha-1,2-mannosidase
MLALGAKALNRPEDLELASKLTDGCVWAYSSFPSGIMPERFKVAKCNSTTECHFDEKIYYEMLVPKHIRTFGGSHHKRTTASDDEPTVEEVAQKIISTEGLPSGFTSILDPR